MDPAAMSAMRGEVEPDPADPGEGAEDEGAPSAEKIEAAKRLCAAVEGKNYRAIVAAFADLGE